MASRRRRSRSRRKESCFRTWSGVGGWSDWVNTLVWLHLVLNGGCCASFPGMDERLVLERNVKGYLQHVEVSALILLRFWLALFVLLFILVTTQGLRCRWRWDWDAPRIHFFMNWRGITGWWKGKFRKRSVPKIFYLAKAQQKYSTNPTESFDTLFATLRILHAPW